MDVVIDTNIIVCGYVVVTDLIPTFTWQSYTQTETDATALPWDGSEVAFWRANRSFGTPTIRVIPTVHEGNYKGSKKIKLNAGVDWCKGMIYLADKNVGKLYSDTPRQPYVAESCF